MHHVPPERWPWLFLIAAGGAFATSLVLEPVGLLAMKLGPLPPKLSLVFFVNIVYPACIVAAAWRYPRWKLVPLAALGAILAFTLGRALIRDWHVWQWRPPFLLEVLHPVVVVGGAIAGAIATGLAVAISGLRAVGVPDAADRCAACGYLLRGITGPRCPECGAAPSTGRSTDSRVE